MVGDTERDEADRTRVRDSPHTPQETPSLPSPETATYCNAIIHRRILNDHITIAKAKQRARQYANHREMREKKEGFLRREPRDRKYQPPTASDSRFHKQQTAGGAQLITPEHQQRREFPL